VLYNLFKNYILTANERLSMPVFTSSITTAELLESSGLGFTGPVFILLAHLLTTNWSELFLNSVNIFALSLYFAAISRAN
jgi:hypothetical protein